LFKEHGTQSWELISGLKAKKMDCVDTMFKFAEETFFDTSGPTRTIQIPISIQFGALPHAKSGDEKRQKKPSAKAKERRLFFDGAKGDEQVGIFTAVTGAGFKPVAAEQCEDIDAPESAPRPVEQIHVTKPATALARIGLVPYLCATAQTEWHKVGKKFPADVFPAKPDLLPTNFDGTIKKARDFPTLRKNTTAASGLARGLGIEKAFRTRAEAYVWNLLTASSSLIPYIWVAKLTAGVLVVSIEDRAKRQAMARSAEDGVGRRFFNDAEVKQPWAVESFLCPHVCFVWRIADEIYRRA
jgi:hypothetical protein